ncbi:efflux RND transporter permease subunit, partial [bacterium]|nr:efflux RND transporter permease subunit [bacterium]
MSSETRSLIDLSVLARWTIVPRLNGVPGVANVSIWGQRRRQLQVQVDPARLQRAQVSLSQVIEATGNALWVSPLSYLDASVPGTGGWVETPNQRLGIQHVASISTPEDLAQVTVEGTPLRLGDLAAVVEDHQPLIGDALIHDAPALMLVVEKFPWANTIDVTRGVEDAVAALQLGLPGVEMDTSLFRPATYLELARANLARTALVGAALAILVLLGLLLNWRTALITILTVVLSVLAAGVVLHVRGTAVNMMLLAGLMVALAVVVDDAVIATHGVVRRLREGRGAGDDRGTARLIVEAVLETRRPMLYATVIVLLAVAPVFFMTGVFGVLSQEIAVSYGIALLASFVVALTAVPTLCFFLLHGQRELRQSPVLEGVGKAIAGLTAAGRPAVAVFAAIGGVVVAAALVVVPDGPPALPELQERDVLVEFEAAPGTSDGSMRGSLGRVAKELRGIPGVRSVSAHLGRAILSDRVSHVDSGELWVSIERDADYHATVGAIRATAYSYPGFDIDVNTYLTERMKEDEGADDGIVVRVYGENLARVREKAEEVRAVLAGIDGIEEPRIEFPLLHPNLEIEVDIARAKAHGLKPGDVRRAATTLLGGIGVGSLFEEQKVFDVVVWGTPEVRRNMTDVQELLIDTPRGGQVLLKDVADLRVAASPKVINRESVSEFVDVTADVKGRGHAAVAAEVQDRIRRDVEFPLEYRAEVMGNYAVRAEARSRVRAVGIAAAIGILLLLQVALGSWRLATLAFLSLPLAVAGGLPVAWAGGGPMAIGSVFGLLAVFG